MELDDPPPRPFESILLGYIDRFGVRSVLGRDILSAGEIRRMIAVENIIRAHQSRKASDDWVKWTKDNPAYAAILHDVESVLDAD
jgi:hypothetical protein